MMEWIGAYGRELAHLVNEMSPYLLLGFFFAGLLRVVFPRRIITRYMGGRDLKSVVNASLLGVPMPLCSCGVLPTGIGFYKHGASRGSTVSFLISTPQTGVDSIIATYAMLGLPLAIIRPIVALLTGIFGGLAGNLVDKNNKQSAEGAVQEDAQVRSARELFRYGFVELLQDISKWLIIGLLGAALLAVLIPDDFFTRQISNEYLTMLIMLVASVPLYICATGSIPIAAVLLLKGLSPGAALVLLMAGPATNFATMAVIGNAMGRRTLWVYLLSIIGGALLFGILVDELLPRSLIMDALPGGLSGKVHEHGMPWWQWLSSAVLLLLIANGYLQKLLGRKRNLAADQEKQASMGSQVQTFRVEGMTCNHCKASVEKGLKQYPEVKSVHADPEKNLVNLEARGLPEEAIRSKVEALGYVYKGRVFRI